ncbi:hypothetical protein FRC06_006122 [Ceratobasidium sp. 370]|nr:hypothetical protein FRC06_006122 [Ceratobasidium sp. 370]
MSEVFDIENDPMVDPIFARGAFHLLAAKYFMLASFVILVYDHILTFSDEVDRVWQREWTGATWLFTLNRYLTELQFIVNLVSFHDPSWTAEVSFMTGRHRNVTNYPGIRCERFIPFPGVSTLVSVAIAEIVLILRTYAAFWLAPLAMDTVITGLTVFKTLQYLQQQHGRVELVKVVLHDGLLYFAVILVANLSNCLVYLLAPPDLKMIGASFSQIITILMISRLQLNLRSDSICSTKAYTSRVGQTSSPPYAEQKFEASGTFSFSSSLSRFFASTVSDLGKDIGDPRDDGMEGEVVRTWSVEVAPDAEIEMGLIRPARGRVLANDMSISSLQEIE